MNLFPLKCTPCYKEYIWGGTRLHNEFRKSDAPLHTAESWELAAHPDGCSLLGADGVPVKTLQELGEMDREAFWGRNCTQNDEFPILVKLIDAQQNLSIQVHPSDSTARTEEGERGKTEAWYVVDAEPRAYIYFGFSEETDPDSFLELLHKKRICEHLNKVQVRPGDAFLIRPGTIHAIGRGALIAEVQQNSNTTFRVFDYDRVDAEGRKRQLHIERAVDVADYSMTIPSKCRPNRAAAFPEFEMTEIVSCEFFKVCRLSVHTEITQNCDGTSFHHLLCIRGDGKIIWEGGSCPIALGDSYFIPAAMGEYRITGECTVLLSHV